MFDAKGRSIHYLRLSVTDLCNLRCRYCMPDGMEKLEREDILTYEEFLRLAALFAKCGVDTVRVTGGEPLVRKGVDYLVAQLKAIPGILMPAIILGGIFSGYFTPSEAAAVAVVYALLVSTFVYRDMSLKKLYTTMLGSAKTSAVIMNHPKIKLLSVTGGEAVVGVAMKTGKKCIAAGPGNPPVIVDETARIPKAAKDIVDGASFDNNVLCVAEKEVFCVNTVYDQLMSEMQKNGAWLVKGEDIDKIVRTVLINKDGKSVINRKFVGHDATYIMDAAGVSYSGAPRLVIAEVPKDHPFVVVEMLMPVLGCVRCDNVDQAIDRAVEAERGCWHSALMHSTNYLNMSKAAKALNTTIFVKNGPSTAGVGFNGEGYATLTIATPTGEGLTSARSFTRARRCVLEDGFRII